MKIWRRHGIIRALDKSEKGYFSIDILKISIEIEVDGVKILSEILCFSTEIEFSGVLFSVNFTASK